MKILGFMVCHYGSEYLRAALESIEPHVDLVHISYSKNPSQGFSAEGMINPDTEEELHKIATTVLGYKLIWDTNERFDTEVLHRAQRYKHSIGFEYILSCDADEVMLNIPEAIQYADTKSERYYGTNGFIHFWKDRNWVFRDEDRPLRLEKLTVANTFFNPNLPLKVLHFGYCQNIETIRYKLSIFGHKNEVVPNWLQDEYILWKPSKIDEMTWLHPTSDDKWEKPEPYLEPLPEVLRDHPVWTRNIRTKVLFIPMDWHRHPESPELFTDQLKALNIDCEALIYGGNLDAAIYFQPEVILFQASMTVSDLDALKKATKALVVMYSGDARYSPPQSLIDYKGVVDAYLVPFSGKVLDTYVTILGRPVHFMWEHIQNWRYVPNQHLQQGEICFVGNTYNTFPAERAATLEYVALQLDPELRGAGYAFFHGGIDYQQVPAEYNRSYAVICENNFHDLDDYFTPRNLGALAAGSCALMHYFPGIEKHFQNLVHCIYYRNKYELLEWIQFLKLNSNIRNSIAENGFKLAWDKFSCKNWAGEIMRIVKSNYLK